MKTVYRISIILNILFAGYILIRGGELLIKDYLLSSDETVTEQRIITDKETAQTANQQEHVTCDTLYTVSEYDLSTGRQEIYQEILPASLIGMNRQQVLEWIDDYNLSAPLQDLEKGFCSMELIAFSPQEIKIRKRMESVTEPVEEPARQPKQLVQSETVYSVSGNEMVYGCILAQDGLLTVYDAERRHVILYTDIWLFDLPTDVQQEILEGKEVSSEQELYNLLESYTS